MKPSLIGVGMLLAGALFAGACGTDAVAAGDGPDAPVGAPADPAAGACLEGATDCNDIPGEDDAFPAEVFREAAQAVVGTPEEDLADDVRVARRGDEQFMLTEDYVLGRLTVELDEVDGRYVVTSVTVELPDGPETFDS